MGLNYSRKNDVTLYSSDRIVQLTGNGLLTFSPRIPGFDQLYTEQEVVYFDDQFDLAEKFNSMLHILKVRNVLPKRVGIKHAPVSMLNGLHSSWLR